MSGASSITLGQAIDFSSIGATSSASDPQTCTGSGPVAGPFTETIWYSYAATDATTVIADANTFDYLAVVFVMADTGSGLQVVDCSAFPATVSFTTSPGVTYDVMIGSLPDTPGGGTGTLTLNRQIVVSVSVDADAALDVKTGVATVTGTISCSEPADFGDVEVSLSQSVGRFIFRGSSGAGTSCDQTPQQWAVGVTAENGSYSGGRATASIDAFACTATKQCSEAIVTTDVRLRR